MFVTKAWSQMKDREVGDKGSLATQLCMPGQENLVMEWSVCQKAVMSEGPFVFHFVHGPQILSFPSAQTHGVISSPTRGVAFLPAFPYSGPCPNFTPQRDCPQRLC